MRKIYFAIGTFVIAACLALVCSITDVKQSKNALLLTNIEALAGEHGAGESTANKKCPIWTVETKSSIGTDGVGVTITCTTGGSYKCEEGSCPHKG